MVVPSNGHHFTLDDVKEHSVLTETYYDAPTRVINLENTLWGTTMHLSDIRAISQRAHGPMGSIITGSSAFIKQADWSRKHLGGSTRASGVIAAPARVAIGEVFLGGKLRACAGQGETRGGAVGAARREAADTDGDEPGSSSTSRRPA
ncbi:hypothetical protein DL768_003912 [Monosporascus sp. mg162]|nr:hypothetical protein DL768_003912 [Monosporascus sp. mg162]